MKMMDSDISKLRRNLLMLGAAFFSTRGMAPAISAQLDSLYYGIFNVKDAQFAGGAKGDGVSNDTLAFAAASARIQAAGGGTLDIPPGTYIVGLQAFANGTGKGYAYAPTVPIKISNCVGAVRISGNGAVLRLAPGLKFGSFDPVTGLAYMPQKMPFVAPDYQASVGDIVTAENNASVEISDLEVDGNVCNVLVGGQWGDTGYQLAGCGFNFSGNRLVKASNLHAHHCCLDGIYVGWKGLKETDPIYPHTLINVRCLYNSRQGISWCGGNNLSLMGGKFSYTGKNGYLASMPKAGIDIEPTLSFCKNGSFIGCEFIDNAGGNPGPAAQRPDIQFINCKLVGVSTYSWYGGGYCKDCTFEGMAAVGGGQFLNCFFTAVPETAPSLFGNYCIDTVSGAGSSLLDNCNLLGGKAVGVCYTGNSKVEFNHCVLDGTDTTGNTDVSNALFTGLIIVLGPRAIASLIYAANNSLATFRCTLFDGKKYIKLFKTAKS